MVPSIHQPAVRIEGPYLNSPVVNIVCRVYKQPLTAHMEQDRQRHKAQKAWREHAAHTGLQYFAVSFCQTDQQNGQRAQRTRQRYPHQPFQPSEKGQQVFQQH